MDPSSQRGSLSPRVLVGKILLVNGLAFAAISLLLGGYTLLSQAGTASTHGTHSTTVTALLALIFAGVGLVEGLAGLALWLLPGGDSPTATLVNHYFAALETQDYASAFQDLDLSIGAPFDPALTQEEFITRAQAYDAEHGSVTGHALVGVQALPSQRVYTIKVTRWSDGSYRTRLRLAKRADEWKIVGFDRF